MEDDNLIKLNNINGIVKNDLKYIMKDFVEKQIHYLNIERQEEEKQTLDNLYKYSARVENINYNFLGIRKNWSMYQEARSNRNYF